MSDLTNHSSTLLEPSIRRDVPIDLDAVGIVTLTAFAFMKSAVLDWRARARHRQPCISRAACMAFQRSLTSQDPRSDIAFPSGLQVWVARYQRKYTMEAQAFTEEMKGYRILLVTYVVGSFIFQVTYPRWSKPTRKRPDRPFFRIVDDFYSVPIWPNENFAHWPPPLKVGSRALESFRQRLRRVTAL